MPRLRTRRPVPLLAPFVELLWHFESDDLPHAREQVLPDGSVQLLVNLHEDELRTWQGDRLLRTRGAGISGPCDRPFTIDTAEQRSIAGVMFRPGGAAALLGVPACAVRNLDVELADLWGRDGAVLRERLLHAGTADAILATLERTLAERLSGDRDVAVEAALARFDRGAAVRAVASAIGLSERQLHRRFEVAVGLSPKRWSAVRRFQRVLHTVRRTPSRDWAEVALACGYYDQSHLVRDFTRFAGMSPTAYRPRSPEDHNHVVIE